jgi:spore coat polysaccharide biosynthesis protein SpsF
MIRNYILKKNIDDLKIVAIVQARINSTRYRGKVMKLLNKKPIIEIIHSILQESKFINNVVIATSINSENDKLVNFLEKNNIDYFRGSENDVLDRYYKIAKKLQADLIVRVTGENPLIDVSFIDKGIKKIQNGQFDYVSNNYPRTFPLGLDFEVFTFDTLERLKKSAKNHDDLEHVSLYLKKNRNKFKTENTPAPKSKTFPNWRLTVDTIEDYKLIKKIFEFYKNKKRINYNDVISLLNKNPLWLDINKNIVNDSEHLKLLIKK